MAFDPSHRPPPGQVALAVRKFLAVVGVSLLLVVLWLLRDLVLIVFVAALVASGFYGVVAPIERRLPRPLAIGLAYLALVVVFAGLMLLIVPPLVDQATRLAANLPRIVGDVQSQVSGLIDSVAGAGAGERFFEQLAPPGEPPEIVFQAPLTLVQIVVNTAVMFFVSALLLLERDEIRNWGTRFLVARDRGPALELARAAVEKLGTYVRGQLVVMVITGVGTATGMILLDVPFALPMGLLGFLSEAIPLAGPFIVGIPVVTLAFLEGPITGILMLGWFLVLQQLEGWLIYPVVHGRILSLSPIVVVLAVIAGANLYGVLGAVIAVPAVAVIDVVLRDVVFPLRQRQSGRDAELARAERRQERRERTADADG